MSARAPAKEEYRLRLGVGPSRSLSYKYVILERQIAASMHQQLPLHVLTAIQALHVLRRLVWQGDCDAYQF